MGPLHQSVEDITSVCRGLDLVSMIELPVLVAEHRKPRGIHPLKIFRRRIVRVVRSVEGRPEEERAIWIVSFDRLHGLATGPGIRMPSRRTRIDEALEIVPGSHDGIMI